MEHRRFMYDIASDNWVCHSRLNSTSSHSPSSDTMSLSSLSLATNGSTSSTPPTFLDKPKCDRSGLGKLWRRYWTCFSVKKSKPKPEEKSTRGHCNGSAHDSSYSAMGSEERDEHLKAVVSYCNNSKGLRDPDENLLVSRSPSSQI
ncbi:hypothetical protein ACOSP7_015237 [Xanthoceras sorbifolium]